MTIEPGCPWYEAQQTLGAPNVNWCEPTVCSLINEPANSWSNLSYLLAGLILMRVLRDNRQLWWFSPTLIAIAILSFTYHATNNYFTQFLDFISMFLMMSFLLTFNLKRLLGFANSSFFSVYWFLVFLNTCVFIAFDIFDMPAQKIMLLNTVPIIALDLLAGFSEGKLRSYRYFFLAALLLGAAQAFAIVDIKRIWCEPGNAWLHGHVMWHILSGLGLLFMGFHMRKMSERGFFT